MNETKRTIFSVPYSKAASIEDQANNVVKFLIENKNLIVFKKDDLDVIRDIKSFASTPMFELYSRVLLDTKLNHFTLLDFSEFGNTVPELFLLNDFVIDGKFLKSSTPDMFKNAWINMTPILGKRNPITKQLTVSDIPRLHGLIARAFLTMSYHDTDAWLTPSLNSFIIESYSTSLTMLLQRSYNLNPEEYLFIQILFAAYYAQLLSSNLDNNGTNKIPPLLSRCGFLGSMSSIVEVFEQVQSLIPHDRLLTMSDIVNIIIQKGPARMSKLQLIHLYKMFSAGTIETQSMMLALDFPPYWVHQLLKLASGIKNPMLATIFKSTNLKRNLNKFIIDLLKSPTLEIKRK